MVETGAAVVETGAAVVGEAVTGAEVGPPAQAGTGPGAPGAQGPAQQVNREPLLLKQAARGEEGSF